MLWAITPTGGRMPVDYAPNGDGNVLLLQPTGLGELLAVTLSGRSLELAQARRLSLRLSHFARCPEAEQFRRDRA
jgi:hypothetical protein